MTEMEQSLSEHISFGNEKIGPRSRSELIVWSHIYPVRDILAWIRDFERLPSQIESDSTVQTVRSLGRVGSRHLARPHYVTLEADKY